MAAELAHARPLRFRFDAFGRYIVTQVKVVAAGPITSVDSIEGIVRRIAEGAWRKTGPNSADRPDRPSPGKGVIVWLARSSRTPSEPTAHMHCRWARTAPCGRSLSAGLPGSYPVTARAGGGIKYRTIRYPVNRATK